MSSNSEPSQDNGSKMDPLTIFALVFAPTVFFLVVTGYIFWLRSLPEGLGPVATHNRSSHSLSPTESSTDLAIEEGSTVQQDEPGQLPYERQTEWTVFTSQESLIQPSVTVQSEIIRPKSPKRKWLRSLFQSMSLRNLLSRSRARPQIRVLHDVHLDTLVRTPGTSSPAKASSSCSRAEVSISGLEDNLWELPPVEPTSTLNSEKEESRTRFSRTTPRPLSAPMLLPSQSEQWAHFAGDHSLTFNPRIRGGSIANQTAGAMPEQPIPPPPPVPCHPSRYYSLSRGDSTTGLSSMSLATADSAILDDGIIDLDLAYSAPPAPSPFVVSSFYNNTQNDRNQASSTAFNGPLPPPTALSREGLSTRFSGQRSSSLPHASSKSLGSNVNARVRPQINPLQLNPVQQEHFMDEKPQTADREHQSDPAPMPEGLQNTNAQETIDKKEASVPVGESPVPASETLPEAPPPSSSATGNKPFRKGHRRQFSVFNPVVPPSVFESPGANKNESDDVFTSGSRQNLSERQRLGMGAPKMMPRRSINMNPPRRSPARSFKSPSMMTIWEDDGDDNIPKSPTRTSAAASKLASAGTEQGSSNILDDTEGAVLEHSGEGEKVSETPSVRLVQDADTATPTTDKAVGLGVMPEASTPGSLYDRDGFLKVE